MSVRTPAQVRTPSASSTGRHLEVKKRRLFLYVSGALIVIILIWLLMNPLESNNTSESGFKRLFGGFKDFFATIEESFSNRPGTDTNTGVIQNDEYIQKVENDLFPQFEE